MSRFWLSKPCVVGAVALGVAVGLLTVVPGSAGADPLRADATLQSWDAEQFVTSSTRITGGPTVVVTPAGTAVAMWLEQRLGAGRVVVSTRSAGSPVWSSPQVLVRGAFYATIEAHGRDRVTVAWQNLESDGASISARTRAPDGQWRHTQQIAHWQQNGGVLVSLVLASNANGDMAAVWTRGDYVRVSYRAAGGGWQPESTLDVLGANAYTAFANVDRDGEVDVVFGGPIHPGTRDLYAYHRALDGTWSGQKVARYASGYHFRTGQTFTAAANADGDLSIAWMKRVHHEGPWLVKARFRPAGGSFTTPEVLAKPAQVPDLDIDAAGITTVTWLASGAGSFRVDLARRSADGAWSPTQTLASRSADQGYEPQLAVDVNSLGDAVVHLIGEHEYMGGVFDDHRMFRCPAGAACGEGFQLDGPLSYRPVSFAIAEDGGATALWTRGCETEECIPSNIRSRQMVPVG